MKRFVCLDLEMSELTEEQKQMICGLRNEIIQIGAVMLDENYNMISEFNTYVKPCYSSVTQSIKELTGITNERLENADDFITQKFCGPSAHFRRADWGGHSNLP